MTLYFQVQFLKLKCTETQKAQLKAHWKVSERKKYNHWKKYQGPEKKIQGTKVRYYRDPEIRIQYRKRKVPGKSWARKAI